jgi:phosphoribosylamine--glycine ligase
MRVLFISQELIAGDVARRIQNDGHDVRLCVLDATLENAFIGMVPRVDDWHNELDWVGKDGLIFFDDVGFGKQQDDLRKDGYTVFGGSEEGERLETERAFGQKIFQHCGLHTPETHDFQSLHDAHVFAKTNRRAWVIKCTGHLQKHLSYIGNTHNGADVVHALEHYAATLPQADTFPITLQERIFGIEMGIGRYFNGSTWVGPIEYNIEHPRLYKNIGPIINEMGTLAWYGRNENERLYQELLVPMGEYLRATDFRGDFSINSIINEEGIYPIEATARMGTPIVHLQTTLHKEPWLPFLHAVASGKEYPLSFHEGFGVVLFGALPPFPYPHEKISPLYQDMPLFFDASLSKKEQERIHFEEIALRVQNGTSYYHATGPDGYCLYTSGTGKSVKEAQQNALRVMQKIHMHKLFYRPDIGDDFIEWQRPALQQYGVSAPPCRS